MRNFNVLALLLVSTLAVSACGYYNNDDDMGYLGSRDDIIVNNRGLPVSNASIKKAQESVTKAKIETVKSDTAKLGSKKLEQAAKKEATDKVQAVVEEAAGGASKTVTDEVTTIDVKPMDTTIMKGSEAKATTVPTSSTTPIAPVSDAGDTPLNAKPGECYAKVLIPGVTERKVERIQVSEEQKVLARIIPAKYDVQTERILVKEARQYWKPGRGPVEKVDEATGNILCLIEEPAQYKTIKKRVLISPEQPEYKTVPARFEDVTKTVVIKPEYLEWRRILCDTNVTPTTISQIQRALQDKGYNSGPIDGRFGQKTLNAINKYQKDNGLASRGITYETLSHLGVSLAGA